MPRGANVGIYIPHLSEEERSLLLARLRELAAAVGCTAVSGRTAGQGVPARLLLALDAAYRRDPEKTIAALRALIPPDQIR
jgi:hypothetical protein